MQKNFRIAQGLIEYLLIFGLAALIGTMFLSPTAKNTSQGIFNASAQRQNNAVPATTPIIIGNQDIPTVAAPTTPPTTEPTTPPAPTNPTTPNAPPCPCLAAPTNCPYGYYQDGTVSANTPQPCTASTCPNYVCKPLCTCDGTPTCQYGYYQSGTTTKTGTNCANNTSCPNYVCKPLCTCDGQPACAYGSTQSGTKTKTGVNCADNTSCPNYVCNSGPCTCPAAPTCQYGSYQDGTITSNVPQPCTAKTCPNIVCNTLPPCTCPTPRTDCTYGFYQSGTQQVAGASCATSTCGVYTCYSGAQTGTNVCADLARIDMVLGEFMNSLGAANTWSVSMNMPGTLVQLKSTTGATYREAAGVIDISSSYGSVRIMPSTNYFNIKKKDGSVDITEAANLVLDFSGGHGGCTFTTDTTTGALEAFDVNAWEGMFDIHGLYGTFTYISTPEGTIVRAADITVLQSAYSGTAVTVIGNSVAIQSGSNTCVYIAGVTQPGSESCADVQTLMTNYSLWKYINNLDPVTIYNEFKKYKDNVQNTVVNFFNTVRSTLGV